MNPDPRRVLCPHCGAPLDLDPAVAGQCPSCRGAIRFAEPLRSPVTDQASQAGLVPPGLDYEAVAAFIKLTLMSLSLLSGDPVVQQYASAAPDAQRAISELSRAVAAAGTRVRDTGQLRGYFDQDLRYYTAQEIWLFDLAIDVLAMLGALGGLPPRTRASVAQDVRLLDGHVRHRWKKAVRQAGGGPAQFRELRAHVPRHQPHPVL
jgi:hypothetical protein